MRYTYEFSSVLSATALMICSSISLALIIYTVLANWQLFKKLGGNGWECLVPFYGNYVLFEAVYGNGWKFLTLLIPFYNIYVSIKLNFDLAKGFGKGVGFGFGLWFLNPIFLGILAFDESEWNGWIV